MSNHFILGKSLLKRRLDAHAEPFAPKVRPDGTWQQFFAALLHTREARA